MKTDTIHLACNFLFYLYAVISFLVLLFNKNRIARIIIICIVPALVMIIPTYFQMTTTKEPFFLSVFIISAILVIPFTYSIMIGIYYNITDEIKYFYLYTGLILTIPFVIIFDHLRVQVLTLYLLFFCIFLFFTQNKIKRTTSRRVLQTFTFLATVNFLMIIKNGSPWHLFVSIPVFLPFSFAFFIKEYSDKLIHLVKQMANTNESNKKLSHKIARLKQSNEQCRRIIAEKDTELYQLSRHASLAEVTTGIAHELAQPLTGIKGIAQNMVDDLNYDDFDKLQALSELQKISSLVDKSSSIIDHIRNFSKKSNFSMKLLDINTAILEAIDLVNHQLRKNNIELICNLNHDLPFINGDTISIEQLIVNLILNAKDAIIEKTVYSENIDGIITIDTKEKENEIILVISDNGVGIPKNIIPKIWSPFFTSKKRNYGTGVGLSISSKIIKEHTGRVYLSTSNDGTSFSIHFPIVEK